MQYLNETMPAGSRATERTLQVMRELVLQASRSDPRIRSTAMALVDGFANQGPTDVARSVENLARSSFVFVDEAEELLIDPSAQLNELEANGTIHGDCDDVAMFVAALLYSIGVEVRFKAVSAGLDGSYQHVFAEYRLRGLNRWIPVDPTIDGIPVYAPGDWIALQL